MKIAERPTYHSKNSQRNRGVTFFNDDLIDDDIIFLAAVFGTNLKRFENTNTEGRRANVKVLTLYM